MDSTHILNFNAEREREPRVNLRAVERHLHDDHYVRWCYPGIGILEGTSIVAPLTTPRFGVVSFPKDATTSSMLWTFGRPSEWVTGKIKLRIWHSSPVGSTNNFRAFAQIASLSNGEVSTAAALALSANLDYAGPAVANTITRSADFYATSSIDRSDELIGIRVGRVSGNAADTNANAFHVYAVRAEFVLAVRESQ